MLYDSGYRVRYGPVLRLLCLERSWFGRTLLITQYFYFTALERSITFFLGYKWYLKQSYPVIVTLDTPFMLKWKNLEIFSKLHGQIYFWKFTHAILWFLKKIWATVWCIIIQLKICCNSNSKLVLRIFLICFIN